MNSTRLKSYLKTIHLQIPHVYIYDLALNNP